MDADEGKVRVSRAGQMLPGIAGICMFLIFLTMVNAFEALRGVFGVGASKYGVLALCTLMAVGLFGLLRLKKWGWSVVAAGCLLLAAGYLYLFTKVHQVPLGVNGLFMLLFFLYLARPETRERLV